jgi:hypothetical protein
MALMLMPTNNRGRSAVIKQQSTKGMSISVRRC